MIRVKHSVERIRLDLAFDPELGVLTWRCCPHKSPTWNMRFAGKVAGTASHGYRMVRIDMVAYPAHRVAWAIYYGEWPAEEIDHKNGVRSDNRIVNLRVASRSQNQANTPVRRDSISGFKGVSKDKRSGRFYAYVRKDGVKHYLGGFACPEAAFDAYRKAAYHFHGDFAAFASATP